jgi:serine/threonine-protein kinase
MSETALDELRHRLASALGEGYALGEHLGSGGCAVVFAAHERALAREVAIKVLRPELDHGALRERFRREAQAAARLDHPHVLSVLGTGERDGLAWYAMPMVRGRSLAARLATDGALPVDEGRRIIGEVASALAAAHAAGIVHRDIKPDNILLDDGTAHVRVADFGVAKILDDELDLTATGLAIGTPAYMAPEQLAGDAPVGPASDVWAFGLVAYEVLTGERPFRGSTMAQLIGQIVGGQPATVHAVRPEVPPSLSALVMRCMAKEPDARPRDGAALLMALTALARGQGAQVDAAAAAARPSAAAGTSWSGGAGAALGGGVARWRHSVPLWLSATGALAFLVGVGDAGLGRAVAAPLVLVTGMFGALWQRERLRTARAAATVPPRAHLTRAGTSDPVAAMRLDRRVASAIMMQMPRAKRLELQALLAGFDQAIAHAEQLLALPGQRDAVRALARTVRAARVSLEQEGLDAVPSAVTSLQAIVSQSGATTPAP